MINRMKFYIDGAWVDPAVMKTVPVVNPATEETHVRRSRRLEGRRRQGGRGRPRGVRDLLGHHARRARRAARARSSTPTRRAARTSPRADLRRDGRADADGRAARRPAPASATSMSTLRGAEGLSRSRSRSARPIVVREPIGVVGMITPWNWPLNQIACKVAPALAAGCTMVLKPSEFAPTSALIFAEIMHEAGVPKGVFNLVNGAGPGRRRGDVRASRTSTWSRSPARPAPASTSRKRAADTVKRVSQELGGKSPNIILDDADLSQGGRRRRGPRVQQLGPVLQRADPHARAGARR